MPCGPQRWTQPLELGHDSQLISPPWLLPIRNAIRLLRVPGTTLVTCQGLIDACPRTKQRASLSKNSAFASCLCTAVVAAAS